ncbi:MAG: MgtC/SapB family protein [Planctomycetes bacterium]|nr:MgtC/SapB family protein [Planctomycetota bacterium]
MMDARKKSNLDPIRITQRVLKFVLVPAAIFGGLIAIGVEMRRHPEDVDQVIRLTVAAVLGGLIGVERQLSGHWAGLRTHMLVGLGAAIFVVAGSRVGPSGDATRVIQGIAAGIGFLGAGTILKLSDRMEVVGLTTASSIWLAAAVGTSAGLALYTLAIAATVLSLVVLAALLPLERKFFERHFGQARSQTQEPPG